MTEEKKVITIDDIEYTEDQLSDEAKGCVNHIGSLDQKIASTQFNLTQLQVGREAFMQRLKQELEKDGQKNTHT
tara:strand:+ start:73 stop:294 length:222 start_codon:yes stop_codon:yes gene_type:complete